MPIPLPVSVLHKKRKRYAQFINGEQVEVDSNYTQGTRDYLGTEVSESVGIDIPMKGVLRRITMPQIVDVEAMLTHMRNAGVRVDTYEVSPADLIPTQSEFNKDKVLAIMQDPKGLAKPIVISKDNFIIDGHHRWLAAHNLGKKTMACITVNLNIEQALEIISQESYTDVKDIREGFSEKIVLNILKNFGSVKRAIDLAVSITKMHPVDRDAQVAKIARMHGMPVKEFFQLVAARMNESELRTYADAVVGSVPLRESYRTPTGHAIQIEVNGTRITMNSTKKFS